jgi:hypothetical protein
MPFMKQLLFLYELDNTEDEFYGDCENIASTYFLFSFQETDYSVPAAAFFKEFVDTDRKSVCFFKATIGEEESEYITLGNAFLKYFYPAIDLEDNHLAIACIEEHPGKEDISVIDGENIPGVVFPPSNDLFGKSNNEFKFGNTETIFVSNFANMTVTQNMDFGETETGTTARTSTAITTNDAISATTGTTTVSQTIGTSRTSSTSTKNDAEMISVGYGISLLTFLLTLLC